MDYKTAQIEADKQQIIDLGGPAAVARMLGLDPSKGGVQRVQNWMARGIPAQVRLDHFDVFGPALPKQEAA